LDDYDALDQLRRRAARTFEGFCDELHALPGAFFVSRDYLEAGRVLVAESDDGIAGFAMWLPIGEATAHMEGLFVDPPLWRSGLGKELIQAICDAVKASGFRNLSVIAVGDSPNFYRRYGFVRTGATPTPLGPALTMMKEVAEP
jgi:GNAT superfamily N-acetyltransferase